MKKILKILTLSITCTGALQTFGMDTKSELASIAKDATQQYAIKIIKRILNPKEVTCDAESIQTILDWAFWRIAVLTYRQGTLTLESQFKSTYINIAHSCLKWVYKTKQFDLTCEPSTMHNAHFITMHHNPCPNDCGQSCKLCQLTARLNGQIQLAKQHKKAKLRKT